MVPIVSDWAECGNSSWFSQSLMHGRNMRSWGDAEQTSNPNFSKSNARYHGTRWDELLWEKIELSRVVGSNGTNKPSFATSTMALSWRSQSKVDGSIGVIHYAHAGACGNRCGKEVTSFMWRLRLLLDCTVRFRLISAIGCFCGMCFSWWSTDEIANIQ